MITGSNIVDILNEVSNMFIIFLYCLLYYLSSIYEVLKKNKEKSIYNN